jgi:hypothetical protein
MARKKRRGGGTGVGGTNISGLMLVGIAMIFLAVGFIVYPITVDATDDILDWSYTGTSINLTVSTLADHTALTGMAAVTGITPLIILLGFVVAGAITGFMGVRAMRSGSAATLSPRTLMLLSVGMIFMAVALIIFPVILDGIAAAHETVSGSSYTYTGLAPILRVVPLIVLTAFIAGSIVSTYFGGRRILAG